MSDADSSQQSLFNSDDYFDRSELDWRLAGQSGGILPMTQQFIDDLVAAATAGRIDYKSTRTVIAGIANLLPATRRARLATSAVSISQSIAHALDLDPTVRRALAGNRHAAVDLRIQDVLTNDTDPAVILMLIDTVDLDQKIIERLVGDCPFVEVRASLARRRIPSYLLGRLANDPSATVRRLASSQLHQRDADRLRCAA